MFGHERLEFHQLRITQCDVLCHAEMIGDFNQRCRFAAIPYKTNCLALHYLRVATSADLCCRFGSVPPISHTSGTLAFGEAAQDQGKGAGQEAGDGRHNQRPAGHVVIE